LLASARQAIKFCVVLPFLTKCGVNCHFEKVSARTDEAPPSGVWSNPTALVIDATTVEIYWEEPLSPNGVINEYRLVWHILNLPILFLP